MIIYVRLPRRAIASSALMQPAIVCGFCTSKPSSQRNATSLSHGYSSQLTRAHSRRRAQLSDVHAVLRTTYRFAGSAQQHVAGETKSLSSSMPCLELMSRVFALWSMRTSSPLRFGRGPVLRVSFIQAALPNTSCCLPFITLLRTAGRSWCCSTTSCGSTEGVGGPPAAIVRSGYDTQRYAAHEMRGSGPNGGGCGGAGKTNLPPPRAAVDVPSTAPSGRAIVSPGVGFDHA